MKTSIEILIAMLEKIATEDKDPIVRKTAGEQADGYRAAWERKKAGAVQVQQPSAGLVVQFDGHVEFVDTVKEAVAAWRAYRDLHDLGASDALGALVKDGAGKAIARISYNGRVWDP